jgi:hypothetical protein
MTTTCTWQACQWINAQMQQFTGIEFEVLINKQIDAAQWRRGFTLSLWDLVINRFPMYAMAHTFRHYGFMDRIQVTFRNLLDNENARMLALEEKK